MFGDRNNALIEPPAPAAPISGLPGGPGEGEVHLLDRLSVIYRYRKVVVTVIIVVLIGGAIQTMTTTPEYRATAQVQIDDERSLPGLSLSNEQSWIENSTLMSTQIQAMRSKDLVRTIVPTLRLTELPEFNGQGGGPTGLSGAIASIRTRLMSPIRSVMSGESAAPPSATSADDTPLAAPDPQRLLEDRVVDVFLSRLSTTPVMDSRAIRLDFVSSDPVLAAAAANELAKAFIEQNLRRRRGYLDAIVADLRDQVAGGDARIRAAEADMASFRERNNASALADPSVLANQELQRQADFAQAEESARVAKDNYDKIRSVPFDDPRIDTFPQMFTDGEVRSWRTQLTQRQSALARLPFGPEHPDHIAAVRSVEEAREELRRARDIVVERLRLALQSAESEVVVRRNNLATVRALREQLGSKGIDYDSLRRYRDAEQATVTTLTDQLANYNIQANAIRNNVWLQDSAVVPSRPFKPDFSRNMLLALFVGFALAGALAFGLDYLDDTIKTPEDITRKLRVPFLGLVPSVRGDKQPVLSGPVPHDFGEAYRALRTSLVFTSGGESTRIITSTSAQPLEGKTTTACNLAMVLAFGGSRVLLIDADMRRPGVHKALKINNTVGLSHLLVGQARVREAIQRTSDPNFCVMTAGRTPPNPSELLASERMKQLIANLKQGPFDWVIIDTPPVLAVTDAVILTPLVDGVTFVLGAEMTRRRLAERAVQMLMVSRPRVVGAVLNRVNFDRNKYYYSRYYGYQYKSYYGSSAGTTVKA